ncbi:hypothetical protein HZH68_011632 [Vespula germanica]|uniref:Uncharacterized protein n=1 Tax=Vespula germanica TaxID=30212 RepID=A0A834MYA2_VESGE|nr:hypothetical protein HZH68_011632 [Vespula germanica]
MQCTTGILINESTFTSDLKTWRGIKNIHLLPVQIPKMDSVKLHCSKLKSYYFILLSSSDYSVSLDTFYGMKSDQFGFWSHPKMFWLCSLSEYVSQNSIGTSDKLFIQTQAVYYTRLCDSFGDSNVVLPASVHMCTRLVTMLAIGDEFAPYLGDQSKFISL